MGRPDKVGDIRKSAHGCFVQGNCGPLCHRCSDLHRTGIHVSELRSAGIHDLASVPSTALVAVDSEGFDQPWASGTNRPDCGGSHRNIVGIQNDESAVTERWYYRHFVPLLHSESRTLPCCKMSPHDVMDHGVRHPFGSGSVNHGFPHWMAGSGVREI